MATKHGKQAPRRMRYAKQPRNRERLLDVRCGDCHELIGTARDMSESSTIYLQHLKDEHAERWAVLEAEAVDELEPRVDLDTLPAEVRGRIAAETIDEAGL
jgi:hypothetical protein